MGSTSFRYRCPECGRRINWDYYWKHVLKCVRASVKKVQLAAEKEA